MKLTIEMQVTREQHAILRTNSLQRVLSSAMGFLQTADLDVPGIGVNRDECMEDLEHLSETASQLWYCASSAAIAQEYKN